MRSLLLVAVSIFAMLTSALAATKRACIAPEDALRHINKDICITVHIYRVVDAADGIHFLDVCSPETSDADCHFFILSLSRDEKSIGDIQALVNQTIQIRGTVHTIQGRAEIVFSSEQQLHGGKEKFHPNPQLMKSFSAENGGQGFSTRNGTMGQRGVHFSHRGR
jgi:hypothetical protein